MIEIKDLLNRWTSLLTKGEGSKVILKEVLSDVLKIDIKTSDIEIKNGTVYLNIKPIYKNEVFLKKQEILNKLEKSMGERAPSDIR